jgi:hypothetical protein
LQSPVQFRGKRPRKNALYRTTLIAAANKTVTAAPANQQGNRVDHQGFTGPGLTGQHIKALP